MAAGRQSWLEQERAMLVAAGLAARGQEAEAVGQTAVYTGWDGQVRGVLVIADTIKPTSAPSAR